MPKKALVIRVDSQLARSVEGFIESPDVGYGSISEFAETALRNQLELELEEDQLLSEMRSDAPLPTPRRGLLAVPSEPPEQLVEPRASSSEELFVLTNRLGPIKIACRVLSNMRREGRGPTIEDFQESAARSARQLGLKLRERELAEGLRGSRRISTAFPIGKNERAALNRFISSFTVGENQGAVSGPLAILGLANIKDGSVYLTEAGWKLAAAPSPLLGEAPGTTLSSEESAILIKRIADSPGERQSVARFLDVVRTTGGAQSRVDHKLRRANPPWSSELATSYRAAMVGRLGDLGVVSVDGRGPKGVIKIADTPDALALVA